MSDVMDIMLKIGITERRIRNPHCTQAAQQCKLMACPRTAQRTEAYRPSVHFSGRPSAALDHPQEPATLFLPVQSASHLSFSFALIVRGRAAANHLRRPSTGGFPMFRTLMIGAVSAAAFAQRRFGLIIAAAVLASIFAGLPISTVEAQSGIVGHGQKAGKRFPFKAQRELPQVTPEQKRLREEMRNQTHLPGPPLPEAPRSHRKAAPADPDPPPTASPTEVLPIGNTFTFFLSTAQDPYPTGTSLVAEPQAAVAADGTTVFYTGNWFASLSTDGGASFTFVDPRAVHRDHQPGSDR